MEKTLRMTANVGKGIYRGRMTLETDTKYNGNTIFLDVTTSQKEYNKIEYYGEVMLIKDKKEHTEDVIEKEYYLELNTMEATALEALMYDGPELVEYLFNKNNLLNSIIEMFNDKESINNYIIRSIDTVDDDNKTYKITTQHNGIAIDLTVSFNIANTKLDKPFITYEYTAEFSKDNEKLETFTKDSKEYSLYGWKLKDITLEANMKRIIEIWILPEIKNYLMEKESN
jgi:hypothetical protein